MFLILHVFRFSRDSLGARLFRSFCASRVICCVSGLACCPCEIADLKQSESKSLGAQSRMLDQAAETRLLYVTTVKALEFKLSTHTLIHI